MPKGQPSVDRDAVLADYQDFSIPVRDVAHKHGIGVNTLTSWARAAGLSRPHGGGYRSTANRDDAMADWRNLDLTITQIVQKHSVARETLLRWAAEDDVVHLRKSKPRRISKDQSPAVLDESAGAWVYGQDGIARWTPGAKPDQQTQQQEDGAA